ncbi:hypothetical protein BT93_E2288 [Corymbia citriodora subsp. variegata]|nr:hypothetical protein BT93_E2288 [Corymbia citriodora subsp. variegata]
MDNNQEGRQATADEDWIKIEIVKEGALASITKDMDAELNWLNESAGQNSCSIFRVPHEACRPRIVSIGPYHHGEPKLQRLQEHKRRYLRTMLSRTQPNGVSLEDLIDTLVLKVKMIRQCYLESTNNFNESDLVKMMVLDGCFIIEFFRQKVGCIQSDNILPNDSYTNVSLVQDLLRLESQVPYFVLEDLFEKTNVPKKEETSFTILALKFFDGIMERSYRLSERDSNRKTEHLLDLLYLTFIPERRQCMGPTEESSSSELLGSASKLNQAGIAFVQSQATLLEIKFDFKRGIMQIPKLTINDTLQCILHNMVAFERCFVDCDDCVTAYAMFMGFLIDTADDARLLCDRGVMWINGVSKEGVASFFRDVSKDIIWDLSGSYLVSEIAEVKKYVKYQQICVFLARLIYIPCRYTWSTIAAIVMLIGAIQTVYTVLQFYQHK